MENKIFIFSANPTGEVLNYCFGTAEKCSVYGHKLLRQFVNEQVKLAFQGSFIPDETIYEINVPDQMQSETQMLSWAKEQVRDLHKDSKTICIPLREATYVYEIISPTFLKDIDLFSILYQNHNNPAKRGRLDAYIRYHNERDSNNNSHSIMGIVTDRGLLCFDDSGRGVLAAQAYLQYMADHYFDRQNHDLKKLSLYYFLGGDKEIIENARNYSQMFNPLELKWNNNYHFPEFKPDMALYSDPIKLQHIHPAKECCMGPNLEHYKSFLHTFNLYSSATSNNIAVLLQISENG